MTIPQNESVWKMLQKELKAIQLEDRIVSHGRCSQMQLADIYRHCQLSFLPTLLEVFSATTLESMFFQLPTVATDFDFNREVMGNSCLYYEPMNAKMAAEQIRRYVTDDALRESAKVKMEHQLVAFSDYENHFNGICDFLKKVVEKEQAK